MNDIIFIICAIIISICGGALVTYLLLRKKLFITRIEDEYIA
jgi:flagellar basal body-associated protein FliL